MKKDMPSMKQILSITPSSFQQKHMRKSIGNVVLSPYSGASLGSNKFRNL